MTTQDQLYSAAAKLTGLPQGAVEKAAQSLSGYTRLLMEEGDHQAFRWPHLGIWKCKSIRLEKLGLPPTEIRPKKTRGSLPKAKSTNENF